MTNWDVVKSFVEGEYIHKDYKNIFSIEKTKTLYSYGEHFPMATRHEDIFIVTTRTYSNSTSKQMGLLWRALGWKAELECENPLKASQGDHEENLEGYAEREKELMSKKHREGTFVEDCRLNSLAEVREDRENYKKYFNL